MDIYLYIDIDNVMNIYIEKKSDSRIPEGKQRSQSQVLIYNGFDKIRNGSLFRMTLHNPQLLQV
jgi:hypothetical protein